MAGVDALDLCRWGMSIGNLTGLFYWKTFLYSLRKESAVYAYIPERLPELPWAWLWVGKYLICLAFSGCLAVYFNALFPGALLAFPFLFYAFELPLVFFFPAVLETGNIWSAGQLSVKTAQRMGWFRLYVCLLPLGFRMAWSLVLSQHPETDWQSGCKKVFEWYGNSRITNRA
jgi:hypothetical protein